MNNPCEGLLNGIKGFVCFERFKITYSLEKLTRKNEGSKKLFKIKIPAYGRARDLEVSEFGFPFIFILCCKFHFIYTFFAEINRRNPVFGINNKYHFVHPS